MSPMWLKGEIWYLAPCLSQVSRCVAGLHRCAGIGVIEYALQVQLLAVHVLCATEEARRPVCKALCWPMHETCGGVRLSPPVGPASHVVVCACHRLSALLTCRGVCPFDRLSAPPHMSWLCPFDRLSASPHMSWCAHLTACQPCLICGGVPISPPVSLASACQPCVACRGVPIRPPVSPASHVVVCPCHRLSALPQMWWW